MRCLLIRIPLTESDPNISVSNGIEGKLGGIHIVEPDGSLLLDNSFEVRDSRCIRNLQLDTKLKANVFTINPACKRSWFCGEEGIHRDGVLCWEERQCVMGERTRLACCIPMH